MSHYRFPQIRHNHENQVIGSHSYWNDFLRMIFAKNNNFVEGLISFQWWVWGPKSHGWLAGTLKVMRCKALCRKPPLRPVQIVFHQDLHEERLPELQLTRKLWGFVKNPMSNPNPLWIGCTKTARWTMPLMQWQGISHDNIKLPCVPNEIIHLIENHYNLIRILRKAFPE